ncbi:MULTISPECIES: DinB family protein [Streptomyces]|uniref:DinB family protein n=1 Tax=Streptomyces TaxID=1883 RepID=UPI00163C0801|nr:MULTISPECIES: DinB family protein [Streptomyces]MBC2875521.1 DinB family protein [Streptomyces sp. TYQ1024]UBI35758.1 DinB family protein [Streptomyces mobaraensis]UKW28351.1 DinB family protein [Streptomyces sp. TYQ1024]
MDDPSTAGRVTAATTSVTTCAAEQLGQVGELVSILTADQYLHRPRGASPIAGHVRHCVDHYTAILAGAGSGTVDYDRRTRGGPVETDRDAALARLAHVRGLVGTVAPGDLKRPVEVVSVVAPDGSVARTPSTVGRELVFVAHHAVHHLAVMVPLARALGVDVPAEFGYAPATLAAGRRPGADA